MPPVTIPPQLRIYASFFLLAFTTGAMTARLPDIQTALGLTQGELGLTLISMAIGSIISLTLAAPLIERLGSRITALVTLIGVACFIGLVPFMPNGTALAVVFLGAGVMIGAIEINCDVEIDRIEAVTGGRYMNRAHGAWSVGFLVAALVGATARQLGVPVASHVGGAAVLTIVVGASLLWGMTPAPRRPSTHQGGTPLISFPTWGMVPLCLIGIAAFLIEGSGVDWSAIYMRDVFASPPFIGGLGLALFGLFMSVFRLTIDPVAQRFGSRAVAGVLLAIATVGALLLWVAPADWIALVGFALLGLGASAVYPLAVSAAAQRTDRPSSVNVAALAQMTFVVFFLGPPLLGFIAQYAGIRVSYLVTVPVIVAGLVATRALPGRSAGAPAAMPPAAETLL
jgi:MFS family permease